MSQIYRRVVDTWLYRNRFNASRDQRIKLTAYLHQVDAERAANNQRYIEAHEVDDLLLHKFAEIMRPYVAASNNTSRHNLT